MAIHHKPSPAPPRRHPAWRMLIIAFLAQNCAIGMNFGIYGTIVTEIESVYSTSRTLAASGLALMVMVMGLLSPLVGSLIRRISLRAIMMSGAAICAVGYILLAFSQSIWAVLAIYALVIGPGVCLLGVVPSSTLISNWFLAGKGKALGFVNMPLFVFLFPLLTAVVVARFGLSAVFIMAAVVSVALIPLLALVISDPSQCGASRFGEAPVSADGTVPAANAEADLPLLEGRQLHSNAAFQVIWLGIGLLTTAGIMLTTHIVPLALEKGFDLPSASLLLSSFGLCAAAGSILFGWLADRIGGRAAIIVQALTWIVPWYLLLVLGDALLPLILVAGLAGLVSGGIVGLCGVLIGTWLGPRNFSTAMGNIYFYKVPFLFGAAPLAGYLFDRTGSYHVPIIMHIATFVFVAGMFALFNPQRTRVAVAS